jgi:hypothetical protein
MLKRRFRLPGPSLVISMVALSLVLGGPAVAATAAKHTDAKAETGPDIGPSSSFIVSDNVNDDFEAPSGAQAILEGAVGINGLGSDCWADWTGIH